MASQSNLIKCLALFRVQFLSSHLDGTSSVSVYAVFPLYPSVKGLAPSLPKPPIGIGVLLGAPATTSFPGWVNSGPSGSPLQGQATLVAIHGIHLSLSMSFLYWGTKPGCIILGYRLMITEKSEINNFPLSAVSTPAAAAQDAASLHPCQGTTPAQI